MNNRLRCVATCLMATISLCLAAETVTWTASEQGYANAEKLTDVTIQLDSYITAVFSKGEGNTDPAYYEVGSAVRLYGNNTLTVAADGGSEITDIVLTYTVYGNSSYHSFTASSGEFTAESEKATWTGVESSVTFQNTSPSGHLRIMSLTVSYRSAGLTSTTVTIDDSGLYNTSLVTGTSAGRLSASVTAGDVTLSEADIAWSSSSEQVATIDEQGFVTLVAVGETYLSASYGGSDIYASSSATYHLKVTNMGLSTHGQVITFSELGLENATDCSGMVFDSDFFTVTFERGENTSTSPAYYEAGTAVRMYQGNTMTVVAKGGGQIKSLVIAYASDSYKPSADTIVNTGTYTSASDTWEGEAESVTFTNTSRQWRIVSVKALTTADNTAPVISGNSVFSDSTLVTITANSQATVYYTLDGSTPSPAGSTVYSAPFYLYETTTVQAIAVMDSLTSAVTTKTFIKDSGEGHSIVFSELGIENATNCSDMTFDGVTFTVAFSAGGGGTAPTYYENGQAVRMYRCNTMTVSAKSGLLQNIVVGFPGGTSSYRPDSANIVNVGEYNVETSIWTGEAETVVFTRPSAASGHWRVASVRVGGTGSEVTDSVGTDTVSVVSSPMAYAVLSDSNTVLTFYYDDQKEARGGMSVEQGAHEWTNYSESITQVIFDASFADCTSVTSTAYWFSGFGNLTSIQGMEYLNTSNVTDMGEMFYNCTSLTSLDVSHFNTANVEYMTSMFNHCSSLNSLDISNFDMANVKSISKMFSGCTSLTSLILSRFKMGEPNWLEGLFEDCSSLTSLDVSGLETWYAMTMQNMFKGCSSLKSLDVSNFNSTGWTDYLDGMFAGCSALEDLNLGDFCPKGVLSMRSMFRDCSSLKSLDLSNLLTNDVTDMTGMFSGCTSLQTILAGERWITAKVTSSNDMFADCTALVGGNGTAYASDHTDISWARIDGGPDSDTPGYLTYKSAPLEPYFVSEDTVVTFCYDALKYARNGSGIGHVPNNTRKVVFDSSFAECRSITSTNGWFYLCSSLSEIVGIENLNTDSVTDMSGMFYDCSSLTSLDLSSFNTENVKDMSNMFGRCSYLTSLNISGFKTDNVTSMKEMFDDCTRLTGLDVSGFNTENVTDMSSMFSACKALTSIDVSNFNTENVTDMRRMFSACVGLTSIDVSGFNTEKVKNMNSMFSSCTGLTSLDLSSFKTDSLSSIEYMFAYSNKLQKIYVSKGWTSANLETGDYVFYRCSSLVGGKGTTYNDSRKDYTYARLDGGPDSETPGYFSLKSLIVVTVNREETLDEVLEKFGGRTEVNRTLAAIVWNKETAITTEDLQGINNPNLLIYVENETLAPQGRSNVVVNGVCERLVLTDAEAQGNGNFFAPQTFTARHAEYTHSYMQETPVGGCQGWETLTLPFTVQTMTHRIQGEIAPFAAISGSDDARKPFWLYTTGAEGGISFERAAQVEAYRPYLIAMPNNSQYLEEYRLNGEVTFAAENTEVQATADYSELTTQNYTLLPTTLHVAAADSVYALNTQGEGGYLPGSLFIRNSRDVLPFQCYVKGAQVQGAPMLLPVIDMLNTTTDITRLLSGGQHADGVTYDLGGRPVKTPVRKGIYLRRGEKMKK